MDLAHLSDDELMKAAGIAAPVNLYQPKNENDRNAAIADVFNPKKNDLSSVSEDELIKAAGINKDPSTWDKYGQPFIESAKHGLSDLKDFATFNYSDESPMGDVLRKKFQEGTADRHDYERAFMEGFSNNPGGKILGAAAGLIPEANAITTGLNNWINPKIVEKTGVDPTELNMLEMAAPFVAKKGIDVARSKPTEINTENIGPSDGGGPILPSAKAVAAVGKAAIYPIAHPLKTASFVVETATKPILAATRPIARGILEGDNPITGEPGLKTALQSDVAQEGTRLGEKMGVNFSAGELTGNPTAMGIEDTLANSARWGGRFAEENQKKVSAIVDRFNKTLDNVSKESGTREDVGGRISSAYNNTINSLINTRREQAKIDFNTAYKGSAQDGKYILSNNLFRTLQELKTEGDARLLTASKAEGGALARQLLSKLTTKTQKGNTQADTITLEELGNGLSDFSAAARKPGRVLEDAKTAAQRRIYARLSDALQKDLDAEISNSKGNPERAAMLAVARDNYRNFTNQIADVEKTTLGRAVGDAAHDSQGQLVISPEKIADKFSSMQPSELRATLEFLDKNHPEVANVARRYTLEKALRTAVEGKGLRGEGTTKEFSKAEFVKNLPDKEKLNALLKDPAAYNDVVDVASAMNRLVDWGSQKKGSQTAQRTDFLHSIANWGKGAFYKSIVSDSLAEDLMNPTKRREIAGEIRQNQSSQEIPTEKKRMGKR